MKIVIDIPEEVYNSIKSNEEIINFITENGGGSMALQGYLTIINGKILPKGHGRLIDENEIKNFKDRIKRYKEDYAFSQEEILNILERYEIKYAPTIIEADHKDCVDCVIDKIRAEIEALEYLNIEDGSDGYDKYIEQYEVLKIIDKYSIESEK